MYVGFVGTGSMGSILIDAFVASGALKPGQIVASNRTPSKAKAVASSHPGLTVVDHNTELAERCDWIFLCVKPLETRPALEQLMPALRKDHLLITITSPVRLAELEQWVPCPVARVVPSITNAALSGLTLVEFGSRLEPEQRMAILSLVSKISCAVEIQEQYLRIASDISSCGPAFVGYLLQQMIRSASEETGISEETAAFLASQMLIGMAELLKREIFSLLELTERVCVPGGITGEGLAELEKGAAGLFNRVFQRTHAKFAEDRALTSTQLERKENGHPA